MSKTYRQGDPESMAQCWTSSSRMAGCRSCSTPLRSTTTNRLVVEVARLTGDNVALHCHDGTDGLVRSTDTVDTGESIKVPVGGQCLGRVFNLLGEGLWITSPPPPDAYWPITKSAPATRSSSPPPRF